jgi:hypothetical protein
VLPLQSASCSDCSSCTTAAAQLFINAGCRLLLQETELRTLKAAAEDVASKFDAAVAALAAKRLDVLAEVRPGGTCTLCDNQPRGQPACVSPVHMRS